MTLLLAAVVGAVAVVLWYRSAPENAGRAAVVRNLTPSGTSVVVSDLRDAELRRPARERAVAPAVASLAAQARRVTPAGVVEKLERRITLAGKPAAYPIELVLAAKLVLTGAAALLSFLLLRSGGGAATLLGAVLLPAIGWFGPDALVAGRADTRQSSIRLELADTIDQVTICVEAGLGFESAMARAAETGKGPLAEELVRTLQDMQIGIARSAALKDLAARTDVPEIRQFVTAIIQAEAYGIPMAQVLRVQSDELRDKRRQLAEEQAQKVPVKILFPLMTCILPALFVVILGPAAIRIAHAFAR